MQIQIWSVGRENEPHIEDGMRIYLQKLKPYVQAELVLLKLPRKDQTEDPKKMIALEEELILRRLQPAHFLILLDERGKMLTSPQWAAQLQQCMNQGVKTVVFLIGGAFGVGTQVRQQARLTWSLSSLVFPHQLVRLILSEQLYRAYSILHNSPYHHA